MSTQNENERFNELLAIKAFVENRGHDLVLLGIGGSQAYGLATPESDFDYKGVFQADTQKVLSLSGVGKETLDGNSPDFQVHEVHKFMHLAIKANPTVLETLFLKKFVVLTGVGEMLVANRNLFLSERIRQTHLGYATAQMKRLKERNDGSFKSKLRKRYSKHARHVYRLLMQGAHALETGEFSVEVKNRDAIFAVGEMEPAELEKFMESEFRWLENVESVLPPNPDLDALNEVLLAIRGV